MCRFCKLYDISELVGDAILVILLPLDLAPLEDVDECDVGDLIYPLFLVDLLDGDAIFRTFGAAPVGELSTLVC